MTNLEVVNVKCGGCAKTITKALENLECTNITVSHDTQKISFENGDEKLVIEKLESLGYPLKDSEAASSLLKKAKSYASCAVGKFL
ncbi:TPA: heavy-metal-associated domain-containing protein [Candidatus Gracilibacteria bacterium]|nr:heavy-metal-associated domain-containing protein [Candidatus Gracilibacteria bacterium]